MFCANTIKLIALKDTKRTFRTIGVYLVFLLSAAVIAVYAYFFSALQRVSEVTDVVGAFPLISILTAAGIYALYMAVSSVFVCCKGTAGTYPRSPLLRASG